MVRIPDTTPEFALNPPPRSTVLLAFLLVLLAACDAKRDRTEVDCFIHEATGTYEVDTKFLQNETSMEERAAECEEAGCIRRETAICLFELERDQAGYSKGDTGAQVVWARDGDDPILAWEIWSEVPPQEQDAGEKLYSCLLDAMDGSRNWCGPLTRLR